PPEGPPHPRLVGLDLVDRRLRHGHRLDVVILEMDDEAVEAVRDRRTRRTAGRVLRAEHEVVDEQLRPPSEQIGERSAAFVRLEAVVLLDADPRELLSLSRQLVATPRQLLL